MKDSDIKKLQEVELQILKDFDAYCTKHGIDYSLSGGTLLGAVRHQGFIPWDDDTDSIMTRENHKKFFKAWEEDPMEGYVLQNVYTDPTCGNNHTKIRKKGTKFLTEGEEDRGDFSGIWIDLFVMDKVDNNEEALAYMRKTGREIYKITRGYATSRHDGVKRKLQRAVLRAMYNEKNIPQKYAEADQALQKFADTENDFVWMDVACEPEMYRVLPANLADEYVRLPFCDGQFKVFKEYDKILTIRFGDYMQLPPVEQRVCLHNPSVIITGE
ncbi:MAG: LicD family protein [Clostridiales bacterium]|nr:LicD family protein [Clostridiales bacterium]